MTLPSFSPHVPIQPTITLSFLSEEFNAFIQKIHETDYEFDAPLSESMIESAIGATRDKFKAFEKAKTFKMKIMLNE